MKKNLFKVLAPIALLLCISSILTGCFSGGNPKVKAIEINHSFKTIYQQGEDLDVTGGKLTVTYSDNKQTSVEITSDMISGFTTGALGERNLVITYGGKTCTVEYTTTGTKLTGNYLYYAEYLDNYLYMYLYKKDGIYHMLSFESNNTNVATEWLNLQNSTYLSQYTTKSTPLNFSYNESDYYYYLTSTTNNDETIKIITLDYMIAIVEDEPFNIFERYTRYIPA